MTPAPTQGMALLLDEPPRLVRPTFALILQMAGLTPGDRQAMWIQQVHYWLTYHRTQNHRAKHFKKGRWWVWNTIDAWNAQFPFWSRSTMVRIIQRSAETGIILQDNFNLRRYDRTLWYSIEYGLLDKWYHDYLRAVEDQDPSSQNEIMGHVSVPLFTMPDRENGRSQTAILQDGSLGSPIPEITTETTSIEYQKTWSAALGELELQMTRATSNTWIRPMHIGPVHRDERSATIVLRCPNSYIADWNANRLCAPIQRTLAGILELHIEDLDLQFQYPEPGQVAGDPTTQIWITHSNQPTENAGKTLPTKENPRCNAYQ